MFYILDTTDRILVVEFPVVGGGVIRGFNLRVLAEDALSKLRDIRRFNTYRLIYSEEEI